MRIYDSLVSGVDDSFEAKVAEDTERRQKLLQELMPRLGVEGISQLYVFRPRLLIPGDFDWLIDRVLTGKPQASQTMEAKLVAMLFDDRDRQAVERLRGVCSENAILDAECGSFFKAIDLDSPQAKLLRENLALRRASNQPILLDPSPAERVRTRLTTIESGEIRDLAMASVRLALEPTSQAVSLPGPDVTVLPGWREANDSVRQRIIAAAEKYAADGGSSGIKSHSVADNERYGLGFRLADGFRSGGSAVATVQKLVCNFVNQCRGFFRWRLAGQQGDCTATREPRAGAIFREYSMTIGSSEGSSLGSFGKKSSDKSLVRAKQ